jgi:hypothetical protein
MTGFTLNGHGYTIDLSDENSDSLRIDGATVSGLLTSSGAPGFVGCRLVGGSTYPNAGFKECTLPGDITLSGVFYIFDDCISAVAGTDTPSINLTSASAVSVNFRHYSGGIEVKNLNAGDTMSLEGDGQLVIDASCDGGIIAIRGNFTISGDSTAIAAITFSDDARFDHNAVIDRIAAIQEADRIIDFPNGTLTYNAKGTSNALLTKDLKDPDDAAVDCTEDVIAAEENV